MLCSWWLTNWICSMKILLSIFNLLVPVSILTERISLPPASCRIEYVLWNSYYQSNTIKKSLDDVEIMKREELNRKRRKIWNSYTRIGDFTWRLSDSVKNWWGRSITQLSVWLTLLVFVLNRNLWSNSNLWVSSGCTSISWCFDG